MITRTNLIGYISLAAAAVGLAFAMQDPRPILHNPWYWNVGIVAAWLLFLAFTFKLLLAKDDGFGQADALPDQPQLKKMVQVLQNLWDGRAETAKRILALEERVQALALQNSFGEDQPLGIEPEPESIPDPDPVFAPLRASASDDQGPEPGTQPYPVPAFLPPDAPRPQTPARRRDYHGAGIAQADDSEGNREVPSDEAPEPFVGRRTVHLPFRNLLGRNRGPVLPGSNRAGTGSNGDSRLMPQNPGRAAANPRAGVNHDSRSVRVLPPNPNSSSEMDSDAEAVNVPPPRKKKDVRDFLLQMNPEWGGQEGGDEDQEEQDV